MIKGCGCGPFFVTECAETVTNVTCSSTDVTESHQSVTIGGGKGANVTNMPVIVTNAVCNGVNVIIK